MTRQPALFISHGAPTLALEPGATRDFLARLGAGLGRPQAIVVVSAHWETAVPAVGTATRPETLHDFYGFPEALYRMRYPAPGAPEVARHTVQLLGAAGFSVAAVPDRGLDHGAWVPLLLMFPDAGIPVTQVAVQTRLGAAHHLRLGEALRPLRDEGVLIVGSGSATHDLREVGSHPYDSPPPAWVSDFTEWLAGAIGTGRTADLLDYRRLAPQAMRNHPTEEHLLPLFAAYGAATPGVAPQRIHAGYTCGVIGMDAYRFD
ncbi:MAG TPA: dioxygenase [Rhodocyclaceae bacterium]|nr:MAG: dioxygenase [Betaproteobacteria bacterium CG2_30_68_42]PIV71778.1 MAG: dioxygenase [Rhodocyclales bacterium CG17_big_fil_post_rev_8_21_14_2_50_68_7]PJA56680.1 MAG: dioxygenase [Rhodocyclales bacterium CG_4_9_14_3_um_filter_68_10]HCX34530.1 dioxygenase [Rhodocyclaceae bacterium]